jgi:aryl-alcohol dehydrogenase-like predicted oxidoreductase
MAAMTSARASERAALEGVSRVTLGTVQFGLPYGVANRTGQPDERAVTEIVAAALDGGVTCFDTAATYGTSEEVLGRVLHRLGVVGRVVVVTKVRPLAADEHGSPALARRAIEASVAESRRRLALDCLPVVLFHREADAVHLDALATLRDRGWLRAVGVSCDNAPGPAARLAAHADVAALQVPANVLDPRHHQAGSFSAAAARGATVFVRSVYLQGLLLMPEAEIPPALVPVIPARRALAALAAEAGMSLAELALRCMLGVPGVTSLVLGVDTLAQLRENLAVVGRGPLDATLAAAVAAAVPALPETVLSPPLWPPVQPPA